MLWTSRFTRQPATRSSARSRAGVWAGYLACGCALLYALVSFYWAAGGTAGLDTVGGSIEEMGRAHDARGILLGSVAGVLKVAGGLVALALVRPWGRAVPRWLLLTASWGGGVVLTVYGGLLVAAGALVLSGAIDPAGPVDRTALRWHVMLWDLWFLVWGVLLGIAAWQYTRRR